MFTIFRIRMVYCTFWGTRTNSCKEMENLRATLEKQYSSFDDSTQRVRSPG